MKSYSFTTEDVSKETDPILKSAINFDPKYDDKCIVEGKLKLDSEKLKEQFNKDITRNARFCIEDKDGQLIDLADKYGKSYDEIHKALVNNYKLSKEQTEYILAASHQGSIGGGLSGFGLSISDSKPNPMNMMNRNGNMSKIVIDKDNNVSYTGGQHIMFDCVQGSTYATEKLKPRLDTDFISNDYMTAHIEMKLGKTGNKEITPEIIIDIAGIGDTASRIIDNYTKIKTECKQKEPEKIVKNYENLSNSILNNSEEDKEYKKEVTKEVKNLLSSEEVDYDRIDDIKRLKYTEKALAGIVLDKINDKLKESPEKLTSIAKEIAEDLGKFSNKSEGYLKRFAEDLVVKQAEATNIELPKKNFIHKFVSYIKDKWNGYSKDSDTKDSTLEQLKSEVLNRADKNFPDKIGLVESKTNQQNIIPEKVKEQAAAIATTSKVFADKGNEYVTPPPNNNQAKGNERGY